MPSLSSRPALARLVARLEARADADAAFRALLVDLADALAEIAGPDLLDVADPADAEPHAAAAALDLARPTDDEAADPPDDEASEDRTAAREPVDAARLDQLIGHFSGGGHVAARTTGVPALPERRMPDSVLAAVAARLAVKAEAAAHVAAGGVPAATAALCERAERAGTRLWMLAPDAPAAEAASYRALAAAFDDAAAEAQSALRAAFWALRHRDAVRVFVDDVDEEPDQAALFVWLRETTTRERVYVERHMRRNDPAGTAEMATFRRRLAALRAGTPAGRTPTPTDGHAAASHAAALNAVAYHTRRLGTGADPAYEWDRLGARVDAALAAGLAPSHVRLRELLLPVLGTLPPDHAAAVGLARVLRELDRFATSLEPEPDDDPDEGPLSPDVAALAALLRGRTIAAFGGVPKPHVVERLRTAFSLADVRWEQTREHQSPAPFEAVVAQPDVELVLLFIRWCSHSFEDLKRYCEAHGKAYVRIPAGIHPNRIAHEVLSQVGDRLRARA